MEMELPADERLWYDYCRSHPRLCDMSDLEIEAMLIRRSS